MDAACGRRRRACRRGGARSRRSAIRRSTTSRSCATAGAPRAIPLSRSCARCASESAASTRAGCTSARRARTCWTARRCSSPGNALGLIDDELDGVARVCARLADEHRGTVMAARTLLQQAVPTTFGLKAAGWLVGVLDARSRVGQADAARAARRRRRNACRVRRARGGGRAALRGGARPRRAGAAVARAPRPRRRARRRARCRGVGLGEDRARRRAARADRGRRGLGGRRAGVSSTMPHKQNPARAILARACARGVHAQVPRADRRRVRARACGRRVARGVECALRGSRPCRRQRSGDPRLPRRARRCTQTECART